MTTAHDYSAYTDEVAPDDKLAQLARLALQQHEAEQKVAAAQEELAKAQVELRQVAEKLIPDLMQELQIQTFTTRTGLCISIKEQLRISVPADRKAQAFKWVEEHGGSELVKRAFIIRFGKGDEAWAAKFQRDLQQRKKPVDVERTDDVHSSTLKKFITDHLEQGTDVPLELFGGYMQRAAKVEIAGS